MRVLRLLLVRVQHSTWRKQHVTKDYSPTGVVYMHCAHACTSYFLEPRKQKLVPPSQSSASTVEKGTDLLCEVGCW